MKVVSSFQRLAAALIILLPPSCAQAHSLGIVRLWEARGPFVITVYTSPELASGRAADISILIQKRDSNEPVLDATVGLVLTPPRSSILKDTEAVCGPPRLVATPASSDGQTATVARREQSLNKLVYSASLYFPLAGPWKLDAVVESGADSAKFTCEIPVGLPARPLAGLVPYLALPVLLVVLFATNQWLRGSRLTK